MSNDPCMMSVRELFSGRRAYRIPIYQRAYAWGRGEIETLIRDIVSVLDRDAYYIGSIVLHKVHDIESTCPVLDVIDGQQRLTTLFLTLTHPRVRALLAKLDDPLDIHTRLVMFEERERSNRDLDLLARATASDSDTPWLQDDGIRTGADVIGNIFADDNRLRAMLADQTDEGASGSRTCAEKILGYLLDRVYLITAKLPAGTDLNHYFEVMNTRGEQLEKHEIVKAHLLGVLGESTADRSRFAKIWDACGDFSRHLQAKFTPDQRSLLFGTPTPTTKDGWHNFVINSFNDMPEFRSPSNNASDETPLTLDDILELDSAPVDDPRGNTTDDGGAGLYGAIIDFPNFLLHVLRLHVEVPGKGSLDADPGKVSLDDKRLVEQFKLHIKNAGDVHKFGFRLLRTKFLFDNFVIKPTGERAGTDDSNWTIHRMHHLQRPKDGAKLSPKDGAKLSPRIAFGKDTNQILMLQAMYQVTHQRRVYKEFLYEILQYLDTAWVESRKIDASGFIEHLHKMADNDLGKLNLGSDNALDRGTGVPHFALNLLDYKLWWLTAIVEKPPNDLPKVDVKSFRFAYRTSIEHFLPINLADTMGEPADVDSFGNLCLMTRAENSTRSDHTPDWKVQKYGTAGQSLKFHYMAATQQVDNLWGSEQIAKQGEVMREILLKPLCTSDTQPA